MVSAFSVPKSKRDYKYSEVPGPGQYNPQTSPKHVKQSDPKYSFGKDGRKQNRSFVPGPGSYEPKENFVADKLPSYSMLGRKQIKQDRIAIGPGQYQPKSNYGKQKSPAYSMKGRSFSTLQSKPGPGQYQRISEFQIKKAGSIFGKDSRIKDSPSKVPGPGSYEYQNAIFKYGSKQDPSYGFGIKLQSKSGIYAPGPGQYEPKKQIYSKIGGIMARDMHSSLVLSKTPGPGTYESMEGRIKPKDPSWSLSKSSRDNMYKGNPVGPGQYESDVNFKSVITSSPKYHFGSDQRLKQQKSYVPGPGNYEPGLLKSRKSIRIGQKLKDSQSSFVPGPGSYQSFKYDNDAWLKGQGRYSVGKDGRDIKQKNEVPGPGSYAQQSRLQQYKGKVTFSKDQRLKNQFDKNPGPGSYELKPHFADVPKYLLPDKK